VKRVRGTERPGRRNPHEPRPRAVLPRPPKFLSDEAKREWKRTAPKLFRARLLTELDVPAFTLYCVAWGGFVEAQEKLQFHGKVVIGPGGFPDFSPFVALANKAIEQSLRLMVEFGMTPSSRGRVSSVGTVLVDPNNRFARFFEDRSESNPHNPASKWFNR